MDEREEIFLGFGGFLQCFSLDYASTYAAADYCELDRVRQ